MRHKILATLLTLASIALSSCESDKLTSTPNIDDSIVTRKKLVLEPMHLEANQYDRCTLKARVTNVPLSDIVFEWDMDEGFGFKTGEWLMSVEFVQPKVHNVRVRAMDFFTKELFDIDSIRVDVRPKSAFALFIPDSAIQIIPDFYMFPNGTFTTGGYPVSMLIKTSSPPQVVAAEIDWGDGTFTHDSTGQVSFQHIYFHTGTYKVVLTAYEKFGRYLGSDTGVIYMRPQRVTQYGVGTARGVDVYLVVDSLHPVAQDAAFNNPFALRIHQHAQDAKGTYDDRNFSVSLDKFNGSIHDTVFGTFENDFQVLKSLHVGVHETQTSPPGSLRYSFDLKDLELIAVTTKEIVYRSKTHLVDDFLKNISFAADGMINSPRGAFPQPTSIDVSNVPATKPGPFAVVVFTF